MSDEAATFDWRHNLACSTKFAHNSNGRRTCYRINVTRVVADLDVDVSLDRVMNKSTSRFLRLQHIYDGRQLFVLDQDLGRDVFSLRASVRNTHCDKLANLPD